MTTDLSKAWDSSLKQYEKSEKTSRDRVVLAHALYSAVKMHTESLPYGVLDSRDALLDVPTAAKEKEPLWGYIVMLLVLLAGAMLFCYSVIQ